MWIQLCGPLVVGDGERRIEGDLPGRQGQLLFGFLVARRTQASSRESLMDALWPAGRPAAAEAALSALVSKLRGGLPAGASLEGRSELRLELPEGSFIDLERAREAIHRAEAAVAQERWAEAWGPARVALYTAEREFLSGHEGPWIDDRRRELEEVRLRALEAAAAAGLGLGGPELDAAERAARRLIDVSPYHESGYRLLIETLAARDNVAEALWAYERLRRTLSEELGIAPGAAAQELHQRLLEQRGG